MELLPEVNIARKEETIGVSLDVAKQLNSSHIIVNNKYAFKITPIPNISKGKMEINMFAKMEIFKMDDCTPVVVHPLKITGKNQLLQLTLNLSLLKRPASNLQIVVDQLEAELKKVDILVNHNLNFLFNFKGCEIQLRPELQNGLYGIIVDETIIKFRKEPAQRIQIIDDGKGMGKLFENYESKVKKLKVGGLHEQL